MTQPTCRRECMLDYSSWGVSVLCGKGLMATSSRHGDRSRKLRWFTFRGKEKERGKWKWGESRNLQIPLSVMYVPQQGHTTPQTAPAAVDPVFKHVSLQGTFANCHTLIISWNEQNGHGCSSLNISGYAGQPLKQFLWPSRQGIKVDSAVFVDSVHNSSLEWTCIDKLACAFWTCWEAGSGSSVATLDWSIFISNIL